MGEKDLAGCGKAEQAFIDRDSCFAKPTTSEVSKIAGELKQFVNLEMKASRKFKEALYFSKQQYKPRKSPTKNNAF